MAARKAQSSKKDTQQSKVLKTLFEREERRRSKNALPLGAVKAIKNMPPRLPPNATEAEKEIVAAATMTKVRVMLGHESYRQAPTMLKAAESLQDDVCGPLKRDMNVSLQVTHADLVSRMEKQLGAGE